MTELELKRDAAFGQLLRAAGELIAYASAPLAPGEDPNWAETSVVLPGLQSAVRNAAHAFVELDTAAIVAESTFLEAPERVQ